MPSVETTHMREPAPLMGPKVAWGEGSEAVEAASPAPEQAHQLRPPHHRRSAPLGGDQAAQLLAADQRSKASGAPSSASRMRANATVKFEQNKPKIGLGKAAYSGVQAAQQAEVAGLDVSGGLRAMVGQKSEGKGSLFGDAIGDDLVLPGMGGVSAIAKEYALAPAAKGVKAVVDTGLAAKNRNWGELQNGALSMGSAGMGIADTLSNVAGEVTPFGVAKSALDTAKNANQLRQAHSRGKKAGAVVEQLRSPTGSLRTPWSLEQAEGQPEGGVDPLKQRAQVKAAERVETTNHKQRSRAGINMSANAMLTAGKGVALGGDVGTGAALQAAGHGTKAGFGLARWGKQKLRDAGRGDQTKTSAAKAHADMVATATLREPDQGLAGTEAGEALIGALNFGSGEVAQYKKGELSADDIFAKLRKRD
jgi:hypothetical protein